MLGSRHQNAQLNSFFYIHQYQRILRWLTYSVCLMVVLALFCVYLMLNQATPRFYASTTDGRILHMPAGVDYVAG